MLIAGQEHSVAAKVGLRANSVRRVMPDGTKRSEGSDFSACCAEHTVSTDFRHVLGVLDQEGMSVSATRDNGNRIPPGFPRQLKTNRLAAAARCGI